MPEDNESQSGNQETTANHPGAGGTHNGQTGNPGQDSSESSKDQGQATQRQNQPDDDGNNSHPDESVDVKKTVDQRKQPGLPDSKEEPWSPGSSASDR